LQYCNFKLSTQELAKLFKLTVYLSEMQPMYVVLIDANAVAMATGIMF